MQGKYIILPAFFVVALVGLFLVADVDLDILRRAANTFSQTGIYHHKGGVASNTNTHSNKAGSTFHASMVKPKVLSVARMEIFYDSSSSRGKVSQKIIKNEILRGQTNQGITVNYTLPSTGQFRDSFELKSGNLGGAVLPTTLPIIQPSVSDLGMLTQGWFKRKNMEFGKHFSYDKKYVFWSEVNIPAGQCAHVQIRSNVRDFEIPFTAKAYLNDGNSKNLAGTYFMNSEADLEIRHEPVECV